MIECEPENDACAPTSGLASEPGGTAGRFVVATSNRTTGAFVRALLDSSARSVAWTSRRQAQAELAAGRLADVDVLLIEVASLDDIKGLGAARGPQSPPMIAIAPDGRQELRTAAEAAGFQGCLSTPIDPQRLSELTEAILQRAGRLSEPAPLLDGAAYARAIDLRALDDLAALGGAGFVRDIVGQFSEDAGLLLTALAEAIRAGDARTFRDQAHALRSCAANVGASRVYATCLELRGIENKDLAEGGETLISRIEAEVAQARTALQAYIAASARPQ